MLLRTRHQCTAECKHWLQPAGLEPARDGSLTWRDAWSRLSLACIQCDGTQCGKHHIPGCSRTSMFVSLRSIAPHT